MTAPDDCRCPECGGALDVVTDGAIGVMVPASIGGYLLPDEPERLWLRPAPFAACSSCEFCIEIQEAR